MVVARELAWPTPSATTTALDLASTEVSRQIESYYENIERKNARKETQWEQRGPVDKQEIEERWVNLSVGTSTAFTATGYKRRSAYKRLGHGRRNQCQSFSVSYPSGSC